MQFNESWINNISLEIASKKSEIFAFFGTEMWHFQLFGSVSSFVYIIQGKEANFKANSSMENIFFATNFKSSLKKTKSFLIFFQNPKFEGNWN